MPGGLDLPGAFYYHAWNEVWLGAWVAVDPTFGQFPADATHVQLAEGGLEQDVSLIGVIGHLRFDVERFS
jgi:transglutaminase-like putative cysteine protease